jgi:hypothetical protein
MRVTYTNIYYLILRITIYLTRNICIFVIYCKNIHFSWGKNKFLCLTGPQVWKFLPGDTMPLFSHNAAENISLMLKSPCPCRLDGPNPVRGDGRVRERALRGAPRHSCHWPRHCGQQFRHCCTCLWGSRDVQYAPAYARWNKSFLTKIGLFSWHKIRHKSTLQKWQLSSWQSMGAN